MGERMFPVQDGPWIPWTVAEQVYEVYSHLYGTFQSLERLAERQGFDTCEVELFLRIRKEPKDYGRELARQERWRETVAKRRRAT